MNLNQVTISSNDLERSVDFYKKLGLILIVDALPRYARFECPEGDATFSIHKVESLENNDAPILYFEVDNIKETVESLRNKGIEFNSEIEEKSWLWTEIDLIDPDGNKLKIYSAGKNRKNPPWRI